MKRKKVLHLFVVVLIVFTMIGHVYAYNAPKDESRNVGVLAIMAAEKECDHDNIVVTNYNHSETNMKQLNLEVEGLADKFDAMLVDLKYAKEYDGLLKTFINVGKPVMFVSDGLDIDTVNKTINNLSWEAKIELDEKELNEGLKSFYVSEIDGAPYVGIVTYATSIIKKPILGARKAEKITIDVEKVHDVYQDTYDAIVDLESTKKFYEGIKIDNNDKEEVELLEVGIKSFPSGSWYFTSVDTKIYFNSMYVGRIRAPLAAHSTKYANQTVWDFCVSMQSIPQRSDVYVYSYKTRIGVPFSGQEWVQATNITSNASQNLSLTLAPKSPISWSTDVSGYNVGMYANYDRAVEWRGEKRATAFYPGQMQTIDPGLRTVNYSGSASVRRWFYGDFKFLGVNYLLQPDAYYYNTVTFSDR